MGHIAEKQDAHICSLKNVDSHQRKNPKFAAEPGRQNLERDYTGTYRLNSGCRENNGPPHWITSTSGGERTTQRDSLNLSQSKKKGVRQKKLF